MVILFSGPTLVLHQRNKLKRTPGRMCIVGRSVQPCPLTITVYNFAAGTNHSSYHNQDWRDEYRERMKTKVSKAFVALRKTLVEHPSHYQTHGGKIPLLLRGKAKVTTEINLYATAYNLDGCSIVLLGTILKNNSLLIHETCLTDKR